jgi:hypothetical protein
MRVLDMNELENVVGGGDIWDYAAALGAIVGGLSAYVAGLEMLGAGVTAAAVIFGVTITAPVAAIILGLAACTTGAIMLGVLLSGDFGGC